MVSLLLFENNYKSLFCVNCLFYVDFFQTLNDTLMFVFRGEGRESGSAGSARSRIFYCSATTGQYKMADLLMIN